MLSNWRVNFLCAALAIATVLIGNCRSETVSIEPALAREINRLAETLEALEKASVPPGLAPQLKVHRATLASARSANSPELQLYRLRDAWIGADAISFFVSNHAAQNDLGELERLWNARKNAFEASASFDQPSALHRALAQAAHNRGEKLFRASLPYARTSAPGEGLYYLAEAEGNRRFRDFVLALPDGDDDEASPNAASLRSTAAHLEQELLKFFGADHSSSAAIPVSARMKEARELLEGGLVDGASIVLLETRLELARRRNEAPGSDVAVAAGDSSIARCFASMQGEKGTNSAINRQLLAMLNTFYRWAAADGEESAPSAVTVTLVRWPYT